jgi:hypothetical protein
MRKSPVLRTRGFRATYRPVGGEEEIALFWVKRQMHLAQTVDVLCHADLVAYFLAVSLPCVLDALLRGLSDANMREFELLG